jgi:2-polyprenyl-6-methoxyphenol hydroxylase-like FAD-dependent oxidoreductase
MKGKGLFPGLKSPPMCSEDSEGRKMLDSKTDVLIVGAGPVGMALAITLAKFGLRPLVVERATAHQTTSRAAVIHAHTLDILDRMGVASQMRSEGRLIEKFAIRERDRILAAFSFAGLPGNNKSLLMLGQDRTEAIMLAHLSNLGIRVAWGVTFVGLQDLGDRLAVELRTPEGPSVVEAKYIVGADGMRSAVREACRIPFEGERYAQSFVLADVHIPGAEQYDEVSLFFSPEGLMVAAPLPGGRFRIVATVDDAPEKPDEKLIQSLIDTRGPRSPNLGPVKDVTWASRFQVHHRLAKAYRKGRVFLAGDAAHVHSPAGGQGMNTGLVDAYTLGRLLADVLRGQADETHLAKYEVLRRPAAVQVLRLAGRMTDAALLRPKYGRMLRNAALSALGNSRSVRRRVEMQLSGLARQHLTLED